MLLKSLELQGFKTFPDKITLNFERGVTSVVGPNGSGKSNISDAVRWVLGEQSLRVLRCSKMENVIFGGTPQRKALGYAEVTLTVDNRDRRLPFDEDTVAVTRRYYRSGESEYLINKVMVRLKDINELFMDTGLGRDGYSIIGQGKIDSIVAARSEDRREIFEEAAGISRFRYRKEESERRLSRAEENLVRLRDILTELQDRVGPLKQQAEKAEKFIAYDTEKKGLEIGIWLETLNRSGKVLREHEEKISVIESQKAAVESEIEELSLRIEENYRETNECTVRMDAIRNEAAQFDEKALRTEGEISLLENEISHNDRDMERLEGQLESILSSGKDIEREIEEKEKDIEEKEQAMRRSRERLSEYMDSLESVRRGADEATEGIDAAAVEIAKYNAALSDERVKLTGAASSVSEIRLRDEALSESITGYENRMQALNTEKEELSELLLNTNESITAGENSVKGYELRLEGRRKRLEEAKAQADKLTLDAGEQLRRVKLLEDLERNLEGFERSVKAVMKESSHGVLKGICGPVTKLLKVPRDYAVALETALGGAMQNLVVETEADAKAAVNLLKQRDQGRATFLPLTVIRGTVLDTSEMEDMPGFVGVASRLCSCDEKFSGVKDYLLGRVAVAEDLDSAMAIAKRMKYRFRIVSLDGQVVNSGGSLTGGSKVKNSGLLSRASEIERIREKAAELEKKARDAAAVCRERQNELSSCEAELNAAKGELASLQEERIKISAEMSRAENDISTVRNEYDTLCRERDNSGARIAELEVQKAEAEKNIAAIEEKLSEMTRESEKLVGAREAQMARYDEISKTISDIRMNEFAAQKDKDALASVIETLRARQRGAGEETARLRSEQEEKAKQNEKLRGDIKELEKQIASFKASAEEKRALVRETSDRRNALEQQAAKLRGDEREAAARRENVGHELARLQERSENLRKEYDSITARLWEEYELTRKEAEDVGITIEDMPAAQRRLSELKAKIKGLGAVNVGAVVEYREVSERYEFLKNQVQDVEKSKAELLTLITDLTKQMKEQFVDRFAQINKNFGSIFRELFGGGAAELTFTDESDVLSSGIEIRVQPPGKIVSHIESLSGGEKALVAISIYFAIMRVNPPPFCVLDEIEAALDDVNVTRYAQFLRRMSSNTQFITITHRRGTMEASDILYGVTMQDSGISKLLSLRTEEAALHTN